MLENAAGTFATGSNLDVDAAAEALTATSYACKKGVCVKAAAANAGIVYVGNSLSVTAGTVDATDGFPLSAGDSIFIEVDNPNKVFVFASIANQKVFWIAT